MVFGSGKHDDVLALSKLFTAPGYYLESRQETVDV